MPDSPTSELDSNFFCDCDERNVSACAGQPFYREHEGKRYCVLHFPGKEKCAEFEKVLQRKLENKDFDFRGVWFPENVSFADGFTATADFRGATFSASASFEAAIFSAEADFAWATFSAEAYFTSATFSADAYFRGATFSAEADFTSATFSAEADFAYATFSTAAIFGDVTFSAKAYFSEATFSAQANFNGATFDAEANFARATFQAMAYFNSATFSGQAVFISVTFRAMASFMRATFSAKTIFTSVTFRDMAFFSLATFSAEVSFSSATFGLRADFGGSTFSAEVSFFSAVFTVAASFRSATFSAEASFRSATFSGYADFNSVTFSAMAAFHSATFADHVRFAGAEKHQVFPHTSRLDLQFARFEKPDRVSFHTLDLHPHWFINVDARKFDFTNVHWNNRKKTKAELEILKSKEIASPHRLLATACQRLAANCEDNSRYRSASHFRRMALDAERLEKWRGFDLRRLNWWYWLASGYGERPFQALLVLIGILVLFGLLYTRVGFVRWEPRVASEADIATAPKDQHGAPLRFPRAVSYSAGVMTLQKPEPKPASNAAQTVVVLETILGPLQAALLALAIRRKFMR